jgi:hypothetical protein
MTSPFSGSDGPVGTVCRESSVDPRRCRPGLHDFSRRSRGNGATLQTRGVPTHPLTIHGSTPSAFEPRRTQRRKDAKGAWLHRIAYRAMTAGGARRLTRCLADECEHSSAGPRVQSEIVGRSRGIALRYGGRERERPSNLPHGERWPEPSKRAQGGVSIIEEERLRSSSMIGAPHQQAKPAAISRFAFLVGLAPFASLRLCAFAPLRSSLFDHGRNSSRRLGAAGGLPLRLGP